MMKTLRKSLNAHRDPSQQISVPLPALSKPPSAILPPTKVIKAQQTYRANAPQELSFQKGDFFHVLSDVNSEGLWYEAHNPATGARGLVPCHLFEEFQKGVPRPRMPATGSTERPLSTASAKYQTFYAIVLHDFSAERADELEAKAGDSITVVAQSNREWFVAKPIGRLGRPGLIPVAFVELRDPATGRAIEDVVALMDNGALPRVEEWKRVMLNYKANSIPLGVLDESSAVNVTRTASIKQVAPSPVVGFVPQTHQQYANQKLPSPAPSRPVTPKLLPEGILLSADVRSFHFESEEYWFRVHAVFQPYDPADPLMLPPAKQLVLFRSYNDFYDFQVALLDAFQREAGRPDASTRILPYMPGPADQVDNNVTNARRVELDEYLHKLCELQHYAPYILEHRLVRAFLALNRGDAEANIEPCLKEIAALAQSPYATPDAYEQGTVNADLAADNLSQLQISEETNAHASDGSDYGDGDGIGASYTSHSYDQHLEQQSPSLPIEPNYNTTQPLRPRSRTTAGHERAENGTSFYGRSSPGPTAALHFDTYYTNSQSRSSVASSLDPSPTSTRASQAESTATSRTSGSGRSRSHSNAIYNPPISTSNPQIAFMKIKIFDKSTEDIVAVRVHPKVAYTQLLEKASSRLNCHVQTLRFLDPETKTLVDLQSDDDLRRWLDDTEKHVLYAA